MADTLTLLSAKDFARRIMAGERDFANTRIPQEQGALDSIEGYQELLTYLATQDMRATPFNAEGSDWRGMKARGMLKSSISVTGFF